MLAESINSFAEQVALQQEDLADMEQMRQIDTMTDSDKILFYIIYACVFFCIIWAATALIIHFRRRK